MSVMRDGRSAMVECGATAGLDLDLNFDMERPEALWLVLRRVIHAGGMQIEHLVYDGRMLDCDPVDERHDAFQITVHLKDCDRARIWRDGVQVHDGAMTKGALRILDLRDRWRCQHLSPFDVMRYNISLDQIRAFAKEAGRLEFGALANSIGGHDEIVLGLSQALLPVFSDAMAAHPLFLEHINLALLTHVTQAYGGLHFPAGKKGILAPWQERRAAEFLAAHVNGQFSIATLAQECGLSRSYFTKAFKETFGKTPLRWLTEYRVARASDLLLSNASIAEVAVICGFADQSHLTRAFAEVIGEPPGNWRRHRRSA